jgi:signal transduction histidine kinase
MQQLNAERAANHQLLEALIEHVSIALLCIDDNGKIILMNRSAKRLFNFPYIYHAFALRKVDEQLPTLVDEAVPGESQLIRIRLGGQLQPLSMFTTKFDLLEHTYSLVSLQNIRDELESRELDSWQKLIKVLTHEIMNSVTPIVSLSSVIKEALVNDSGLLTIASLTGDEKMDLVRSLLAIETRGKGLMRFVQSYNNLANIPKPYFTNVAVAALLERTSVLMLPELETSGITLETACEPSNLSLHADTQQVEQILINLVKNAKEAMLGQEQGHISIAAGINHDRSVQITVKDNGSGIAPDKLQDIFIPFYTSKTEGSGIGLSISRQLMLVNKGRIWVNSEVGAGTEFTLMFRPGI